VILYAFGSETDVWWQKDEQAYRALPHIEVYKFDHREAAKLEKFVQRKMQLTVSISGADIYLTGSDQELSLSLTRLL
jgi:uncharacterized protein YaeQ